MTKFRCDRCAWYGTESLRDAEHRLERLQVQTQQAKVDVERLATKLNEAVQAELEPAELHPLALEIVNRIHQGEPADKIIKTLRQECRLPVGATNAIRELANAEHRLERLQAQTQQAKADVERLAVDLMEAMR